MNARDIGVETCLNRYDSGVDATPCDTKVIKKEPAEDARCHRHGAYQPISFQIRGVQSCLKESSWFTGCPT
ncbi:MAG: hypothetical protein K2G90_07625 [Muribaculaceae bacterium]|nr:hypothetical protein [Muribaculaceae bacterium]